MIYLCTKGGSAGIAYMKVLGAISPVVDLLKAEEGTLRAAAAYVVGTAASNNPRFQLDLLEVYPDIFSRLRQVQRHEGRKESTFQLAHSSFPYGVALTLKLFTRYTSKLGA
eukprot:897692-Pelagomonas_calceolata.AAC.1